ncbi:hypothetical protein MASR2M78_28200 [Treponema sp.]
MNLPKTSDLEKELVSRLRESTSGNARAMAATVVIVSSADRAATSDAVVDKLMGRRPARVIHLRGSSPEGLKSWSSARCAIDRQSRGVCFEDIYLESSDDAAFESRSWGPFVIRELPSLLFWNLGPRELCSCGFDCAEKVDLTFLDGSADLELSGQSIKSYAEEASSAAQSVLGFTDLTWERLARERLIISRLFDGANRADELDGIRRVLIRHKDGWSAALLGAWVAERLQKRNPNLKIDAEQSENNETDRVDFALRDGRKATVLFQDERLSSLTFADGESLELSLPESDDGAILARLVDTPLADPLYAAALRYLEKGQF